MDAATSETETKPAPTAEPTVSSSPITTTDAEPDLTPTPTSTLSDTSKLEQEDTFYAGALKRTGTLYEGAKEGVLKRSGTVTQAFSGGLKRTGTLIGDAREGFNGGLKRTGTLIGDAGQGFVQRTATIRETAGQGLQRAGTVLEPYRQGVIKHTGAFTENASAGLQHAGSVLEPYRQGVIKRTGTFTENASVGLQRTGTILASAGAGAVERANSFGQWAQSYALGIYDPDRPYKVTLQEIAGVSLPRAGHTISVISGRAYIFGGEDETESLADNHVHVVFLPSGGVLEADYKSIAPRPQEKDGEVPSSRKGHTAVVVEDEIYIFGGQLSKKAKEEAPGRVWVFNTISSRWTFHDPRPDAPYPPPRISHSATASDLPGRVHRSPDAKDSPKRQYLNPSMQAATSEPELSDSWGTVFVYGGVNPTDETALNDAWAFDICTRTWFPLPPPPAPARPGASLVLINNEHLYRLGGRTDAEHILEADYLDVSELLRIPFRSRLSLPSLLSQWTAVPLSAPLLSPSVRLTDPGDGRSIVVSIQPGATSVTAVNLSPSGGTIMLAGTRVVYENEEVKAPKPVEAVQVQYADVYGEILRGSIAGMRTFSQATAWACEKGSEVEEANLVVWGGKDAAGKTIGFGWVIKVEQ